MTRSDLQEVAYRRPYEALLLCQPLSAAPQAAVPPEPGAAECGHAQEPHNPASHGSSRPSRPLRDMVIIAVPGQHSRKPHIGRLLMPYLPTRPSCLEVIHGYLS